MADKNDWKVPFEQDGSAMRRYAGRHAEDYPELDWRANEVWEDTMRVEGSNRGESSAYVTVYSEAKAATMFMFFSDFTEMVKTQDLSRGRCRAFFTYCRKGSNFGVRVARPKEVAAARAA